MEEEKKVEEVKEEVTTEEVKEEPVGDSESITSEPVKEEVKDEPVKKKSKLPIIILVVLLVAVLVGGIFIGKSLNSKDDKSDTKAEEKDNKKDNKEDNKEDENPEEESEINEKCNGLEPKFKILKYNSSIDTYEATVKGFDKIKEALIDYYSSDAAAYACLNVSIKSNVVVGNENHALELTIEAGTREVITEFDGEVLFKNATTQPYPDFKIKDNKLYVTYYGCDIADGCPTEYVVQDGKLVEVEEPKKEEENKEQPKEEEKKENLKFTKDNMKILEMYVTNSERYSVPSSVEIVGYFDSNVEPEGLCYDNRKDAEPIGDCEEKYTFNINNKNVVIKMVRKDSLDSFYVNDVKLNYKSSDKKQTIKYCHFYFVEIDSKVYIVTTINNEITYVLDLSFNIVNTIEKGKSNILFSKLDGKPIMIVNDVESSLSLDFDDDRANAVYYYIGSNEKHKLTSELNENQYVDLLLTSAAWFE
jgi:hypothetical protein